MSADATDASAVSTAVPARCAVILRTADQYDIWRNRVGDACWAATCKDVFSITDEQCKVAIQELEQKTDKKSEWVGKCWTIITSSLHDDVYRKVNHVARGFIKSLLDEVAHALVVNNMEEVQPLRLELYGATMQKDCGNDLQLWINYIMERGNKLEFLQKKVPQEELVAIFLKGLHPVFNQLQVYFAIPGQLPKTFEVAVTTVRKFATTPIVAAELAKLKTSGMSQNMFPLISQPQHSANRTKQPVLCRLFASSGQCKYGSRCKFQHTATPNSGSASSTSANRNNNNSRQCDFCQRQGHAEDNCNFKQRLLTQLHAKQPQTALASVPVENLSAFYPPAASEEDTKQLSLHTSSSGLSDPFAFMLTTTKKRKSPNWVINLLRNVRRK